MKYLNLIHYPIRLITLPLGIVIWFLLTDWGDKRDVEVFKTLVGKQIRPLG